MMERFAIELKQFDTDEKLVNMYARQRNLLTVESDMENDTEAYEARCKFVYVLENMIIERVLNKHGYYCNRKETYPRWERKAESNN